MPQAEAFTAGIAVEPAKIDRELKKLWQDASGAMTRASLINLAVYSEAPGSLERNTQLVSAITEDHACRAIVIAADREAAHDNVQAWISAHCHVSRAGSKQICSEQLTFLLSGRFADLLPNVLFAHLDSDLPLHFWWQGEFHEPMDPQLWASVDRVIYDSRDWRDFDAQLRLVEEVQIEARQRIVLCDLNWVRLVQFRLAMAQMFDDPAARERLKNPERLEIDHAPGFRSTAILLAGWLAAQLRWADHILRERLELQEVAGEPISRCSLRAGGREFRVEHRHGADLLEASSSLNGESSAAQILPAGKDDPVALMAEELMRGGPHRVYLRAIDRVRKLI